MILREQVRPNFRITVAVIVTFAVLITALSSWGILLAQEHSPPPTNLSAQKTANGIKLSWSAPEGGVDGYSILRRRPTQGEDKLKLLVADTGSSATSHTDTKVNADDGKYIYRVIAWVDGALSKWSDKLTVNVGPGDFGSSAQAPPDTPVPPTAVPPTAVPPTPVPPTPVPPTSRRRLSRRRLSRRRLCHRRLSRQPLSRRRLCHQLLCRRRLSRRRLCHQPLSRRRLSRQPLSRRRLCHQPLCRRQLCHQPLSRRRLCHQPLSRRQLCRRPKYRRRPRRRPRQRRTRTTSKISSSATTTTNRAGRS